MYLSWFSTDSKRFNTCWCCLKVLVGSVLIHSGEAVEVVVVGTTGTGLGGIYLGQGWRRSACKLQALLLGRLRGCGDG